MPWAGKIAGVLLVAGLGGSPAWAVDLVNRDRTPHEVTVNRADGSSETITVKPGERITGICTDCVVLLGSSSVETKGSVTVRIEGGKVSIDTRR